MTAAITLWTVILAVGALNYLSRLSFIALFARRDMPPLMARALRYVPPAMLATIVVPAVALTGGAGGDPSLAPARLAAALVASVVAWRTRSATATMAVGMLALWATQWLLPALS